MRVGWVAGVAVMAAIDGRRAGECALWPWRWTTLAPEGRRPSWARELRHPGRLPPAVAGASRTRGIR